VRAQSERDDLDADDHQQRARDHRVDVPGPAEDVDLEHRDGGDEHAEGEHERTRQHEQVRRAVDEQEA
jgi:hypothetical protein